VFGDAPRWLQRCLCIAAQRERLHGKPSNKPVFSHTLVESFGRPEYQVRDWLPKESRTWTNRFFAELQFALYVPVGARGPPLCLHDCGGAPAAGIAALTWNCVRAECTYTRRKWEVFVLLPVLVLLLQRARTVWWQAAQRRRALPLLNENTPRRKRSPRIAIYVSACSWSLSARRVHALADKSATRFCPGSSRSHASVLSLPRLAQTFPRRGLRDLGPSSAFACISL